jgi:hypothetical protein
VIFFFGIWVVLLVFRLLLDSLVTVGHASLLILDQSIVQGKQFKCYSYI